MNNKFIAYFVIIILALGGVLYFSLSGINTNQAEHASSAVNTVVLHKSPTCGCCGVYGKYLQTLRYKVRVHNVENLTAVKSELGVPQSLESCHTLEVGGYIVEGHVPEEAIAKLLTTKPDIAGIGMPGMPAGSPGMPGEKDGSFVIYEINDDGSHSRVFMKI